MNRRIFRNVIEILSGVTRPTSRALPVTVSPIDNNTTPVDDAAPLIDRFVRDYRPRESVFKAIVTALSLPRLARVLDMGCGGAGGKSTMLHLVDLFDGTIH